VVLVARLRALVRRGAGPRSVAVTVGDLVVDPARRTCSRAGTEIALTGREFALVELLARRAEEVVPKLEILDQVWGPDFPGDPNVVEVYVGYVRRKIDAPFGRQSLQTVRGAGYRLTAEG
jgi:DNA-binding response OmpR family regulator